MRPEKIAARLLIAALFQLSACTTAQSADSAAPQAVLAKPPAALESVLDRAQAAEQRRLAPEPALTLQQGRPTKRDRRDTEKLRGGEWNERWSASIDK